MSLPWLLQTENGDPRPGLGVVQASPDKMALSLPAQVSKQEFEERTQKARMYLITQGLQENTGRFRKRILRLKAGSNGPLRRNSTCAQLERYNQEASGLRLSDRKSQLPD